LNGVHLHPVVHAGSVRRQQLGFEPMSRDQAGCAFGRVIPKPKSCVGNQDGTMFARLAYVAQAQQLPGHGIKEFAPMTAFAIRMRAVSMRWITRWPLRTLVRGPFTKADAIELPAYEDVLVPTGGML
jgi:hypothetical protein